MILIFAETTSVPSGSTLPEHSGSPSLEHCGSTLSEHSGSTQRIPQQHHCWRQIKAVKYVGHRFILQCLSHNLA